MRNPWKLAISVIKIAVGCAAFGLGFNLFLEPNGLNAGGISGLSMVLVHWFGIGTIGTITALLNLPLFALAGVKIGRKFFIGSILGMALSSAFIDLMAVLPKPDIDPLIAALYGGVLCGMGLGLVFVEGASTGGSDIIVRFLKRKWQHVPIGTINICFDLTVAALTGLAYWDISSALYSGVAIYLTGTVIDAVVYRFDYSKVALIVTKQYERVAKVISDDLGRGVTYLQAEGYYSQLATKVILTAVKRQQLAELKRLVVQIDPDAFIIVQDAHQVLGDGFSRYSKDSL